MIVSQRGLDERLQQVSPVEHEVSIQLHGTFDMTPTIALAGDEKSLVAYDACDVVMRMKNSEPRHNAHPGRIHDLGDARG